MLARGPGRKLEGGRSFRNKEGVRMSFARKHTSTNLQTVFAVALTQT